MVGVQLEGEHAGRRLSAIGRDTAGQDGSGNKQDSEGERPASGGAPAEPVEYAGGRKSAGQNHEAAPPAIVVAGGERGSSRQHAGPRAAYTHDYARDPGGTHRRRRRRLQAGRDRDIGDRAHRPGHAVRIGGLKDPLTSGPRKAGFYSLALFLFFLNIVPDRQEGVGGDDLINATTRATRAQAGSAGMEWRGGGGRRFGEGLARADYVMTAESILIYVWGFAAFCIGHPHQPSIRLFSRGARRGAGAAVLSLSFSLLLSGAEAVEIWKGEPEGAGVGDLNSGSSFSPLPSLSLLSFRMTAV